MLGRTNCRYIKNKIYPVTTACGPQVPNRVSSNLRRKLSWKRKQQKKQARLPKYTSCGRTLKLETWGTERHWTSFLLTRTADISTTLLSMSVLSTSKDTLFLCHASCHPIYPPYPWPCPCPNNLLTPFSFPSIPPSDKIILRSEIISPTSAFLLAGRYMPHDLPRLIILFLFLIYFLILSSLNFFPGHVVLADMDDGPKKERSLKKIHGSRPGLGRLFRVHRHIVCT